MNSFITKLKEIFDNFSLNTINKILIQNYNILDTFTNKIHISIEGKIIKEINTIKYYSMGALVQ